MQVVTSVADLRQARAGQSGKIGLIPTMGALHEGHAALIRAAKESCEHVVLSIFVNPLQFGASEDFDKYPRDFDADKEMAQKLGVDTLFAPDIEEIYPAEPTCYVGVGDLSTKLCGKFRPAHFDGVVTVVTKLFNIVSPKIVFFGQKDYQQTLIIERLIDDLNFNITLEAVATVREKDGLAVSSRNKYLNPEERAAAQSLYRALNVAAAEIEKGEVKEGKVIGRAKKELEKEPLIHIEYLEAVDPQTLEPKKELTGDVLFAVAAYSGNTRLIDNILLSK